MSKKDLLKEKAKGKLATSIAVKQVETRNLPAVSGAELKRLTMEIKSGLEEMNDIVQWWKEKKERVNELREVVIEKLIYVRENKKSLLGTRTFEDYLVNEIGLSKGYFYEQLQAYEVCVEYKKPKLFKEVDHKILVNIAREKDPDRKKSLIDNAKVLSREDFKKNKQTIKVSPTDFSVNQKIRPEAIAVKYSVPGAAGKQSPAKIALGLLKAFSEMHKKSKSEHEETFLRGYIYGLIAFAENLHNSELITDDDLIKIQKFKTVLDD
jgi:preprotein translocase subunit SecD